jgi:hypothetical protein
MIFGMELFDRFFDRTADAHDDMTGWHMILLGAPEGQQFAGGKRSEWLFIDPNRKDRFGHEGDTIIPGCCDRWKHLHREKISDESAVATVHTDDEDELPWQASCV